MNNEALNEWMEDNTDVNAIQAKVDKAMNDEYKETWDDIYEGYSRDEYPVFGGPFTEAMTFIEWLKMYYQPPVIKP